MAECEYRINKAGRKIILDFEFVKDKERDISNLTKMAIPWLVQRTGLHDSRTSGPQAVSWDKFLSNNSTASSCFWIKQNYQSLIHAKFYAQIYSTSSTNFGHKKKYRHGPRGSDFGELLKASMRRAVKFLPNFHYNIEQLVSLYGSSKCQTRCWYRCWSKAL